MCKHRNCNAAGWLSESSVEEYILNNTDLCSYYSYHIQFWRLDIPGPKLYPLARAMAAANIRRKLSSCLVLQKLDPTLESVPDFEEVSLDLFLAELNPPVVPGINGVF